MTTSRHAASRGRAALPPLLVSGALGSVAIVLYVLCCRTTSHEYDLYWLLPRMHRGELDYPRHPLSLWVANGWATLLSPFGADLHERLRIASGIGTGLAVGIFTHAAWLLEHDRRRMVGIGVLYACLPANVHFATVMELHALFLPLAASAVWGACWSLRHPGAVSAASGLALGVVTCAASALHATGHLLVPFLGGWLLAELRQCGLAWPRCTRWGAAFVGAHVAGCGALQMAMGRPDLPAPVDAQWAFLVDSLQGWGDAHRVLIGEWLLPFCPVALVCWFAATGASRTLGVSLLLACLVHLGLCQILLVLPSGGYVFHEFGAYQQTLAFFATVVVVRRARAWWWGALFAVALGLAIGTWRCRVKEPADRGFGDAAVQHLATTEDRLLVGCFAEYDGVFERVWHDERRAPWLPRLLGVRQFCGEVLQGPRCTAAELALFFHPVVAQRTTVMTTAARDQLRAAGGIFSELVDHALPATFVLRDVHITDAAGGELRGWRLEPR